MVDRTGPHHYGRVPIEMAASQFRHKGLEVYVILDNHRNPITQQCNPGVDAVAKQIGISVRTVNRGLRELEDDGWIKKVARPGHSNQYQLLARLHGSDTPVKAVTPVIRDSPLTPVTADSPPLSRMTDPTVTGDSPPLSQVAHELDQENKTKERNQVNETREAAAPLSPPSTDINDPLSTSGQEITAPTHPD